MATKEGTAAGLTLLSLAFCAAMFLQSVQLYAQASRQNCDMPVVVADLYNKLVPGLQKDDFSVRLAGAPTAVEAATMDGGPKRIVLVVDASVPEDEWQLEIVTAKSLIHDARPADRFALFVVGEEGNQHPFLTSEEVQNEVNKLGRTKAPEKTYDALFSALNILDLAQFGDAIFLIGHDVDVGSTHAFGEVRDLTLRRGVRFYGISFADKLAKLPPGFDLNKPLPPGFGLSKLESLSSETGYFFSFHAVRSLRIPGQEPLFKGFLDDLYAWIAQPYRLTVENSGGNDPSRTEVDITQRDARKVRRSSIHYARISACPLASPTR